MNLIGEGVGIVVKWDVEKSFGFAKITHEVINGEEVKFKTGEDALIHYKNVLMEGFVKLVYGDKLRFKMYRTNKGIVAKEVTRIGSELDDQGDMNGNR